MRWLHFTRDHGVLPERKLGFYAFFSINSFFFFKCVYVCLSVCTQGCRYAQRPEEGASDSPRAGVTGGCESSDMVLRT